jgi:glycosyltransferase involved in cell wall biosynthesis
MQKAMQSPSPEQAKNPKLLIVVATKNRRGLLERALGSVWSQSYPDYRVVVVDDGSTDETASYLKTLPTDRLQFICHAESRGVNAARNAALRTIRDGEWALQLDDDDLLLPDALQHIANAIASVPDSVAVLGFNTLVKTREEEFIGGYQFKEGEEFHDVSYEEMMLGVRRRGDIRTVLKWTLFPKYFFREDINGFESEWLLTLARDNAGIRYFPQQTTWIDLAHEGEHLSLVASRRDPASFVRAHVRALRDHAAFYETHPKEGAASALSACKGALRALDLPHSFYFFGVFLRFRFLQK